MKQIKLKYLFQTFIIIAIIAGIVFAISKLVNYTSYKDNFTNEKNKDIIPVYYTKDIFII